MVLTILFHLISLLLVITQKSYIPRAGGGGESRV